MSKHGSSICGVYCIKSPYHKGEYYLPFIIESINPWRGGFPVQVSTMEYLGWTRYPVNTGYSVAGIRDLFLKGKLIEADRVPKSKLSKSNRKIVNEYIFNSGLSNPLPV